MRDFSNQRSNVTFVPALKKAEGFAEASKTLQFERHPSHAQYNTQSYPSNQMLATQKSELNTVSESHQPSETLPVVFQTSDNITNLRINASFNPDDSHLPEISSK